MNAASALPHNTPFPILLVEDDAVDAEAFRRLVKKMNIGNPVFSAADGVEAMDMLSGRNGQEKLPQPCLVMLDINMPRMNGLELMKEMRAEDGLRKNVVFILTTSAREDDKRQAYELSAAGYILKEDLGTLAEMLERYCRINQLPPPSQKPN
ncbi:MAG: response regulator [Alphaproteobacteria bacterium]|nr:response regulator [Alphaproteobacteria bacterium]